MPEDLITNSGRKYIGSEKGDYLVSKGILKVEDRPLGNKVFRIADGFDLADFEYADKIWEERWWAAKRRRIEELMSDEAPSKSDDVMIPREALYAFLTEMEERERRTGSTDRFDQGYMAAWDEMQTWAENYGEED